MRTPLSTLHSKRSVIMGILCLTIAGAVQAQSPGGVTGAMRWYKADAGVTTGATLTWTDQTGVANATQTTAANQPAYNTSGASLLNYNPSFTFNPVAPIDMLTFDDAGMVAGNNPRSVFTVARTNTAAGTFEWITGYGTNTAGGTFGMLRAFDNVLVTSNVGNDLGLTGNPYSAQTPVLSYGAALPTTTLKGSANGSATASLAVGSLNTTLSGASGGFIGAKGAAVEGWDGIISEIVYFNTEVNGTNKQKVESYLAIKYGITLDPATVNYVNSAGTTTYNIDATYKNNIIGISRDNASGLLQKQSRTPDDSLKVFVGGATVAASNAANTGSVTNDLSSLIVGNNGAQMRGDLTATKPAGIYTRFARVWKVTNTNFSDAFAMEIKWDSIATFSLSDIRLLVSSSPDFSAATVINTPTVTFTLGSIIVSGITTATIPMNSTMYVTIGSVSASTPLPLELLRFTAVKNQDYTATLDWQTAEEHSSKYFEPEHSSDLKTWTTLGTMPAAGYSNTLQHYQFQHNKPANGLNYYRIKLSDKDGKYSYSDVRTVRFSNGNKITVSPNPVIDKVYVSGTGNDISKVQLTDAAGEAVWQSGTFNNGDAVDMSIYASGIYILKVTNSQGEIETFKLMKK